MPVYDAQVNEEIGGDKSELFASIVRKARAKVDQEKVWEGKSDQNKWPRYRVTR